MAEPELGQPFCGLTSSALAEAARGDCQWTHSPVSVAHQMDLPAANIRSDTISQIFREVVAAWTSVCGIDLRFQDDPNANILARVEPMDGPNGILGESYLPCGNVNPRTQLGQRYDAGERWTRSFLFRVVLHEVGHALGLDHAPQGSAVMSPYLTNFDRPQQWDVDQIQARYGPPRAIPVPPPKPDPQPDPTNPAIEIFGPEGKILSFPVNVLVPIPKAGNYLFSLRNPSPKKVKIYMVSR